MANKSKAQDPADAALSAIEEALNLELSAPDRAEVMGARPSLPSVEDGFTLEPPLARSAADAPPEEEEEARPGSSFGSRRAPANDDRESVGQLLYALQRKPPRTPYMVATILSLLWLAGGAALVALLF